MSATPPALVWRSTQPTPPTAPTLSRIHTNTNQGWKFRKVVAAAVHARRNAIQSTVIADEIKAIKALLKRGKKQITETRLEREKAVPTAAEIASLNEMLEKAELMEKQRRIQKKRREKRERESLQKQREFAAVKLRLDKVKETSNNTFATQRKRAQNMFSRWDTDEIMKWLSNIANVRNLRVAECMMLVYKYQRITQDIATKKTKLTSMINKHKTFLVLQDEQRATHDVAFPEEVLSHSGGLVKSIAQFQTVKNKITDRWDAINTGSTHDYGKIDTFINAYKTSVTDSINTDVTKYVGGYHVAGPNVPRYSSDAFTPPEPLKGGRVFFTSVDEHSTHVLTCLHDDAIRNYGEELKSMVSVLERQCGTRPTVTNFVYTTMVEFAKAPTVFMQSMHLNVMLMGEPGTGKTHCARELGKCFAKIGLLATDTFYEVEKHEMVASADSSFLTTSTLDACVEGVCFIDEAYSFVEYEKQAQAYSGQGKAFADTLTQYATSHVAQGMIICAGYETEMKEHFLRANVGLSRRFPSKIVLGRYTSEQLCDIFESKYSQLVNASLAGMTVLGRDKKMRELKVSADPEYRIGLTFMPYVRAVVTALHEFNDNHPKDKTRSAFEQHAADMNLLAELFAEHRGLIDSTFFWGVQTQVLVNEFLKRRSHVLRIQNIDLTQEECFEEEDPAFCKEETALWKYWLRSCAPYDTAVTVGNVDAAAKKAAGKKRHKMEERMKLLGKYEIDIQQEKQAFDMLVANAIHSRESLTTDRCARTFKYCKQAVVLIEIYPGEPRTSVKRTAVEFGQDPIKGKWDPAQFCRDFWDSDPTFATNLIRSCVSEADVEPKGVAKGVAKALKIFGCEDVKDSKLAKQYTEEMKISLEKQAKELTERLGEYLKTIEQSLELLGYTKKRASQAKGNTALMEECKTAFIGRVKWEREQVANYIRGEMKNGSTGEEVAIGADDEIDDL